MRDVELAYVAGFVDSEGTISLHKTGRNEYSFLMPKFYIANTNKEALEFIRDALGAGTFTKQNTHNVRHKICYKLNFSPNVSRLLLPKLEPFLIIKRLQAQLLLTTLYLMHKGGYTKEEWEIFDGILLRFRELNKRGKDA